MRYSELTERVYGRLLREAGGGSSSYGAVVGEDNLSVTIYDTAAVEKAAEALVAGPTDADKATKKKGSGGEIEDPKAKKSAGTKPPPKKDIGAELEQAFAGAVVAYVEIAPPDEPCLGAYKIAAIVGPGKLAYGMAYALSPSGLIISDRSSMTPKAMSAWKNMTSKMKPGSRDVYALDNIEAPKTKTKKDDCTFWAGEDHLNAAYGGEGGEVAELAAMERRHWAVKKRLSKLLGKAGVGTMDDALTLAGGGKFAAAIAKG